MISRKEILMGRERDYPLTPEMDKNLEKLLEALNKVRQAYGKVMIVSSGYRPGHYNNAAGGARRSAHQTCEAVDFADPNKELAQWCLANIQVLIDAGLYLESPTYTPTWVHLQTRPTKKRIFLP